MNPPAPVRLFLIDDSGLVRAGLRAVFEDEPGFTIAGEAATATDGLKKALAAHPDVILLDLRLPDAPGLELCPRLRAALPAAKVVVLTSSAAPDDVRRAITAGAHGYLLKDSDGPKLAQAIRRTLAGEAVIDPALGSTLLQLVGGAARASLPELSRVEFKLLAAVAEGLSNKEIGQRMELAEKTVKNYLTALFARIGVESRVQAATYYLRHREQLRTTFQDLGPAN